MNSVEYRLQNKSVWSRDALVNRGILGFGLFVPVKNSEHEVQLPDELV